MTRWLDVMWEVCLRTWRLTWRRPVLLTFSLGQPLVWMLFFGFLFERVRAAGEGIAYLDFLAPGVSVMTVLFGASQSGIGWIRDLQTGFLPRMLNTPASPSAILAGKVLADSVRLLLQAAVVLGLGVLLGARLHPGPGALLGLLCLLLFAAAFSCLSCAFALQARAQETMATFVHLVNMPLLFTSTALVPRDRMPDWLASLARWNPLSLTVDAWRGALLFGQTPSLVLRLLPLAAVTGVLFLAARSGLRSAVRRF
ncbi:MAG TPA: ABC transporter permease [Thermoanaerobaculia bacterium]|nr:ABC transporter permease [Thermoanaerobaculia bacterium]